MGKLRIGYVNTFAPQVALREWRHHMTQPARAIGLVGAGLILTLMAPFGTGEVIGAAVPRFAYWLVLVVASYSLGYLGHLIAARHAPESLARRIVIAGGITGLSAFVLVYVLNGLTLQYWPVGSALLLLAFNVIAIASVISVIFQVAYAAPDHGAKPAETPPLLDRLPFEKRGAIVSLTVEDHYVRVRTVRGEGMVLMRLSDAIREVGATQGLQVHRSHWIALDHVKAARRKGDGAVLKMRGDIEIPVSRANVPKLRDLGLLAK